MHDAERIPSHLRVEGFVKNTLAGDLPNSFTHPIFEKTCDVVIEHLQRLEEKGKKWAA